MNWTIVREPTLLITSVVYALLYLLVSLAGVFGIWLGVLVLISTWRYSYQVMRQVAQGHKTLQPPDFDSFNPVGEWSQFWHFIFFPGVIAATAPYQPFGTLVAILAAVIFPASAGLIGATSSLSQAFNPVAIGLFIRTVGSDYWRLVAGMVAIFVGVSILAGPISSVFGWLSLLLITGLEIWALLASFALIGSVLREYRLAFEIGGEVKSPEEDMLAERHREWRRDLDLAYVAFRSGLLTSGYRTLHQLVERNDDGLEINFWLVENMLEWSEKRYAFEVATTLMPRLLARGDGAGALELYQRCRRRDPEFHVAPELAAQLAELAAAFGRTGLAGELGYTPGDPTTR